MKLFSKIYFALLKLRYKFEIIWFDKIDKNKQYVIFPNHEAIVDPQIVFTLLRKKIKPAPVVTETYYNMFPSTFKKIWAVCMMDLEKWSQKLDDVKKSMEAINNWIKEWKNILLYPAWQIYCQGFEVIRWKKSAYNLVQSLDKNVEIITIKTTGLFWSMWSKAWTWKSPNFIKTFFYSIFIIFANLIFFVPKRKVKIEIENFTKKLKNINDLNEFNQTLEDFYNKDGKEEINYYKHYFYYNDCKNKKRPEVIQGSLEDLWQTREINEKDIAKDILEKIITKIKDLKKDSLETNVNISINTNLVNNLYFDSLDLSEIKVWISSNFKKADNPSITSLKSVWDLCIMAIWKSNNIEELKPCNWIETEKETKLSNIISKNKEKLWENTSIVSLWKEVFRENKKESFIYDNIFWIQSRKDFILKAYLIASYIKKIDWKYIWIMLPSISSANLIIISTYLAWKIPVMLNWTLWETALNHCIKYTKIDNILTSKNFYDTVKNPWTEKIYDKYIFLEDLLKNISLFKKIKALISSKIMSIPKIKYEDEAVLLFTSGSESLPKAVSLSHKNLISDIKWALEVFAIWNKEKLIWFLPPFHSFWFTINTIMPLITWLKAAYTPDPTDSQTILNLIKHSKITALTATPTFLNNILELEEELKTLKYAIVWAEKCTDNVFNNFKKLCPKGQILEWYWITECSPVISINPLKKQKKWSVWIAIDNTNIKIIWLDSNKELEAKQEWMIYFAWDNVFNGYLDKDLEIPFTEFDNNKYYKTWDLWYLDEENYLFITWRLKRFIKIAWEMISLPFIEWVLLKKYENIAVEALEKNWEAKIVLFHLIENKIELKEINSYLKENWVSNLVKIDELQEIPELPVLWTWKIDYKVLKGMIK